MTEQQPVDISAAPSEGQLVVYAGKTWQTIREGKAYILVPPNARNLTDPKVTKKDAQANGQGSDVAQTVFYNPIQQFNRDLSVLAIKTFGNDFCAGKRQTKAASHGKSKEKPNRKRKRGAHAEEESGDVRDKKFTNLDNSESISRPDNKDLDVHNRALSSLEGAVIDTEAKSPSFRVLDALSATGLRALRYACEIPCITAVIANDMDAKAVKSIESNVLHNKLSDLITANTGNAIGYMYNVAYPVADRASNEKFDVIDLDPYGTAAPFIDSALQALNDGGLLCVTCTDSGVFASCGYAEKTFSSYGGMPVKGPHAHEGALRIILQSIASTAGRYGLSIEPLLSLSVDFYVRLFIRVRRRPIDVKFLAGKTMVVYECDAGCGAWTTQHFARHSQQTGKNGTTWWKYTIAQAPSADRLCEHCGSKTHVAGPMWAGPIHNASFVEKVLESARAADRNTYQTIPRMEGMLDTALDELLVIDRAAEYWPRTSDEDGHEHLVKTPPEALDLHPFFFQVSALAKVLHCQAPPEVAIKGALRRAGYRATRSHCKPGSIKTDAPWSAIWTIMRAWVKQRAPIKEGSLKQNHAGWKIMYGQDDSCNEVGPMVAESKREPETNGAESPEIVIQNDYATPREKPADPRRFRVIFDEVLGKDTGRKLVRYQTNPRENWGPMTRAK